MNNQEHTVEYVLFEITLTHIVFHSHLYSAYVVNEPLSTKSRLNFKLRDLLRTHFELQFLKNMFYVKRKANLKIIC